ncbi:hypothetical protein BDV12DRAFT_201465 [Aspergillus spectabilis]
MTQLGGCSGDAKPQDSMGWRIAIVTQMILKLCCCSLCPFSPSLLPGSSCTVGQKTPPARFERSTVLRVDVDEAMAITTAAAEQEQELARTGSAWLDCLKSSDGRRMLSGLSEYYSKLAGVDNALGVAQAAFAIQLVGNICSWPLVDRLGRRPMIVGEIFSMMGGLLLIGLISIRTSKEELKVTVAFMTVWRFLYLATLGAISYAVGGETRSPLLRQKTYSINIKSATAVSCAVLQIMPYLLITDEAPLGGKICFISFWAVSAHVRVSVLLSATTQRSHGRRDLGDVPGPATSSEVQALRMPECGGNRDEQKKRAARRLSVNSEGKQHSAGGNSGLFSEIDVRRDV